VTAAGDEHDGADIVIDSYRRLVKYMKVGASQSFAACSLSEPDKTAKDKKLKARAARFGKKLR
jgi:hypothetical protein